MLLNWKSKATLLAMAGAAWPVSALAQSSVDELIGMSVSSLRGEIGKRYDAALTLTRDKATVATDDPRFLWAGQAKAQCGIALGFLKSSTKDPVSIGKCVDAYNRMQQQNVVVAPPPPAGPNPACAQPIAGIVFFEWDSALLPDSAGQIVQATAANLRECGWKAVTITGHTDRSGSNPYNDRLSIRRAEAVAQAMAGQGADRSLLVVSGRGESEPKVPTPDGERNPQNRRVEITVVK